MLAVLIASGGTHGVVEGYFFEFEVGDGDGPVDLEVDGDEWGGRFFSISKNKMKKNSFTFSQMIFPQKSLNNPYQKHQSSAS